MAKYPTASCTIFLTPSNNHAAPSLFCGEEEGQERIYTYAKDFSYPLILYAVDNSIAKAVSGTETLKNVWGPNGRTTRWGSEGQGSEEWALALQTTKHVYHCQWTTGKFATKYKDALSGMAHRAPSSNGVAFWHAHTAGDVRHLFPPQPGLNRHSEGMPKPAMNKSLWT